MIVRARQIAFLAALTVTVALAMPAIATADAHHIILCGSGGEDEFRDKFRLWGTRLRDVLATRLHVPTSNIVLLTEPQTENAPELTTINLESVRAAFQGIAARASNEDDLFVYLIGHGSYLKSVSRLHIPGLDLKSKELGELMSAVPARRRVLVNGTSSSAAFINDLSREDWLICSATKSVSEQNATEFMGFFIAALEDGSADRDHDERVSVLEACEQAADMTAAWYAAEGLLATEHAILDDNGDGLGTRLPVEAFAAAASDDYEDSDFDGLLARETFIKDYRFDPNVPQELIDRYLAALDAAIKHRDNKEDLPSDQYYADLEPLLIDAARLNREIRGFSAQIESDS